MPASNELSVWQVNPSSFVDNGHLTLQHFSDKVT